MDSFSNLNESISHKKVLLCAGLKTIAFDIAMFWDFIRLFDDEYFAQKMNSSPPNTNTQSAINKQKALATCLYLVLVPFQHGKDRL